MRHMQGILTMPYCKSSYYNKIENTGQNFYRKVIQLTDVEAAKKNALQKPDKQLYPKSTDK